MMAYMGVSELDRLQCPKKVLKHLEKAGIKVVLGSGPTMSFVWEAVQTELACKKPTIVMYQAGPKSFSVVITSADEKIAVYRNALTIKPAFGQAIVAYVRLCITSE